MDASKAKCLIGMLLCALAVGCTGPQSPAASGEAPRAAAAPTGPKRIVGVLNGDPAGLSEVVNRGIAQFSIPGTAEMQRMVLDGMAVENDQGVLVARLAEAVPSAENGLWRLSADGRMETTWTIRPGARWHDGTPFTSEDLAFTLQVVRDRDLPVFRDVAYEIIESVETPAPDTLTVRWKEPFIFADTLFTPARAMPLPKHLLLDPYTNDKPNFLLLPYWNVDFVGTGSFKLKEFVRSIRVVFAADDTYLFGRPKIDEVEVRFLLDAQVIIANILSSDVDMTVGRVIPIELGVQVREQWRAGRVLFGTTGNRIHMEPQFIDPNPPIVADARFRKALMHGIDRQQMADTLQYGLVPVAHSLLHPNVPEYKDAESAMVRYDYDPRRASQILEELGYQRGPDRGLRDAAGQRLALETRVTAANPLSNKAILIVADYWEQLGIDVDPVTTPTQLISDRQFQSTFPTFHFRRQGGSVEYLASMVGNQAPLPSNNYVGRNYARYVNAEWDAMIDRFFKTIARPERMEVLRQIIHHFTDQLVLMGLFHDATCVLVNNRVTGPTEANTFWNTHEWDVS